MVGASSHRGCDIISVCRVTSFTACTERTSLSAFQKNYIKMAVESRVTQEEIKKEPEKPVDREKVCFTLYLFLKRTNRCAQTPRVSMLS